jgi:hypothetical protein
MASLREYDDFSAAVTICDADGIIVYMNSESIRMFQKDGGAGLVGTSLFACHSPASNEIIRRLIREGSSNVYTVERAGQRKLVYQTPWFKSVPQGQRTVGGLIELVLAVPKRIRNIARG